MNDLDRFDELKEALEPLELPADPDHTNLCVVAATIIQMLTLGVAKGWNQIALAGAAMIPLLVVYRMGEEAAENCHEAREV